MTGENKVETPGLKTEETKSADKTQQHQQQKKVISAHELHQQIKADILKELKIKNERRDMIDDSADSDVESEPPEEGEDAQMIFEKKKPKLPNFIKNNVTLWWKMVIRQMEYMQISRQNQAGYLIAGLEPRIVQDIPQILMIDLDRNSALKRIEKAIMNFYELNDSEKLEKVMNEITLGDKRPSQLYQEMITTAGNILPKELVRDQFIKKLPKSLIGPMMAIRRAKNSQFMRQADEMYNLLNTAKQMSSISKEQEKEKDNRIEALEKQVAALSAGTGCQSRQDNYRFNPFRNRQNFTADNRNINRNYNTGYRRNNGYNNRSQSRDRSQSNERNRRGRSPIPRRNNNFDNKNQIEQRKRNYDRKGAMCYNHFVFGRNARTCQKPCSYGKRQGN